MNNKFIIIVPVYNAEKYIEKCLESILTQNYDNYKLIVIDDCSTDNTYNIINDIHIKYNKYNNFNKIRNDVRIGSPLANFIKGIELTSYDKEDILITVDGDDYLYNDNVLTYLNSIYQDEDIYMSYGQFIPIDGSYGKYCKPISDTRTYRKSGNWYASHLRTCKKKLWDLVNHNDLKDETGNYYKFAGDVAYMFPIIEIAGKNHIKFINKILYIYNNDSPFNEMRIHESDQLRIAQEIRNKSSYDELKNKI